MIGIYKIFNDINDRLYIGQSTRIQQRWNEHLWSARVGRYIYGSVDYWIHVYGPDHFSYEILEECSKEELDDREIYWIKYYNSFIHGYNLTVGGKQLKGENHPRAILTEQMVWDIRELYAQHVPFREAWAKYENIGISKRGFKKVWSFDNWRYVHPDVYTPENLQWHATFAKGHSDDQNGLSVYDRSLKQDEIDAIYNDYIKGMQVKDLAKKYHRDRGTIEKYVANPKERKSANHGLRLQNVETGIIFPSIERARKWAKCDQKRVSKSINTELSAGTVPDSGLPAHWRTAE